MGTFIRRRSSEKDDGVGFGHRDFGLDLDLLDERVIVAEEDAPGIDQPVALLTMFELAVEPITGDPGLVLHHGNTLANDAVEERRLAHVGSADNNNGGEFGGHGRMKVPVGGGFGGGRSPTCPVEMGRRLGPTFATNR
jgi:hypothetical protein